MDKYYCCHETIADGYANTVSDGLCHQPYWGWGNHHEDPTIPTCWPYSNECACPDTHAWTEEGQCKPKDYCAYAFETCPMNQRFVRNECIEDSVWDYCCSVEYYDYYYDRIG